MHLSIGPGKPACTMVHPHDWTNKQADLLQPYSTFWSRHYSQRNWVYVTSFPAKHLNQWQPINELQSVLPLGSSLELHKSKSSLQFCSASLLQHGDRKHTPYHLADAGIAQRQAIGEQCETL